VLVECELLQKLFNLEFICLKSNKQTCEIRRYRESRSEIQDSRYQIQDTIYNLREMEAGRRNKHFIMK